MKIPRQKLKQTSTNSKLYTSPYEICAASNQVPFNKKTRKKLKSAQFWARKAGEKDVFTLNLGIHSSFSTFKGFGSIQRL